MRPIRSDLEKIVLDALQRASVLKQDAPLLAWPMVCGRMVAQKTQALSFEHGTLTVRVPDAAWRAQLAGFIPQYMAALNRAGSGEVKQIDFVIRKS
jgi:Dna[CI] antecedent, DciA